MTPQEALQEAITRAGNTSTALAVAMGGKVVRQNVDYWLKTGRVPAEHCPAIERATGVRCELLCPEVAWDVLRKQTSAEGDKPAPAPGTWSTNFNPSATFAVSQQGDEPTQEAA